MSLIYRPATLDDNLAIYDIFVKTLTDLGARLGVTAITGGDDPEVMNQLWPRRRPLFEHLANTAERSWIAEQDGQAVGYARSILRDGVRQLTEFFVLPGFQSAGVGRELLSRAFPAEGAAHRIVIATIDTRAVARYSKAGVYPQFTATHFSRAPRVLPVDSDLHIRPLSADDLAQVDELDAQIIGYRRPVDHVWLMSQRQGFIYERAGRIVGYGYIGYSSGPFALLASADFPAVLNHAETIAYAQERNAFGVEVPLHNRIVVQHLLNQGYEMEGFYEFFMTDVPFGRYDHYILTGPPFFT
jgi:GNAT superfamily N-acetyltransferase